MMTAMQQQWLKIAEEDLRRAQLLLDDMLALGRSFEDHAYAVAEAHALANVAMGWTHLAKLVEARE